MSRKSCNIQKKSTCAETLILFLLSISFLLCSIMLPVCIMKVCRPRLTKTRRLIHERSRCKEFRTYKLALSIPCSVCAEVQKIGSQDKFCQGVFLQELPFPVKIDFANIVVISATYKFPIFNMIVVKLLLWLSIGLQNGHDYAAVDNKCCT